MKKKLLYGGLLVCVLALAAVCAAVYGINRGEGAVAEIYKDGELIETVDLQNVEKPYEFEVRDGDNVNVIRVEKGRIRVASASCPDKICVNRGYISDGVMPIVCLPNKLIIKVVGAQDAADAAAR